MKNFFLGLVSGAVVCGLIFFFAVTPGAKQQAYESGLAAGTKQGMETGKAAGVLQGVENERAEQKRIKDSLIAAAKRNKPVRKIVPKPEPPKPTQNWHVVGGKIDEPIEPTPPPAAEPKAK